MKAETAKKKFCYKKRRDLWLVIPAAALLIFLLLLGKALAYFTSHSSADNLLCIGTVRSEIEENFDPPILGPGENTFEKLVCVRNTGTVSCYVRVYMGFSDPNAEKVSELSADGGSFYSFTDYQTQGLPPDWSYEPDGYFYYKKPISAGETTTPLLKTVRTTFASQEEASGYELIIYAESLQNRNRNGQIPDDGEAWRVLWEE